MNRFLTLLSLFVCCVPLARGQVKPGVEVLRDRGFSGLEGKRIGLLTNPSGVSSSLESTIDIFCDAENVNLVALFAPEHGVRGDVYAGGKVEGGTDETTGLPVYSLYGATREPTPEMLRGIDVVVYDIQDVGSRSYTFISTLGLVMRACARAGVEVMVLDRPNPLGGVKIEGPYPREGYYSFVGQYKIPYVYGLTVGELATLINEEGLNRGQKSDQPALRCKLTVVPMEGWTRDMTFDRTGLPWVPTSPNIPYAQNALCYPCAGLVGEFVNYLNIGIGYTLPFGTFAAEWIDADELKEELDSYCLDGVSWRTIHYTPSSGSMKGVLLHGVQYFFTNYADAELTMIQFHVMQAVQDLYGRNPFTLSEGRLEMFDKVTGSDTVRRVFGKTLRVGDIQDYWRRDAEEFRELSRRYHIY